MVRNAPTDGYIFGAPARSGLPYGRRLRISLICSLICCILLFRISPKILPDPQAHRPPDMTIRMVEIPSTDYEPPGPPPVRPAVPVAWGREDLPADITLRPSEFQEFTQVLPPPPPEPSLETPAHSPVQKPHPEGGYEVLRQNIEYPPVAREAGMEGTVVIRAYIDETGQVTQTAAVGDDAWTGFTRAAISGIQRTRFQPARQFDETIGYWDSITVRFKIRE